MNNNTGGTSALTLLGVAFVVMKLCKVIDWSWWWVTIPFWGGIVIAIPILFWMYRLKVKELERIDAEKEKRRIERLNAPFPKKSSFLSRLEEAKRLQDEQRKNRNS